MATYLGETPVVSLEGTPFEGYTKADWMHEYLCRYGGIDGSHHKNWVIDQCSRIYFETPVIVTLARWDDGLEEYRFTLNEPSQDYLNYVQEVIDDGYEVDEGVAP